LNWLTPIDKLISFVELSLPRNLKNFELSSGIPLSFKTKTKVSLSKGTILSLKYLVIIDVLGTVQDHVTFGNIEMFQKEFQEIMNHCHAVKSLTFDRCVITNYSETPDCVFDKDLKWKYVIAY
jgi:hypothetical protein